VTDGAHHVMVIKNGLEENSLVISPVFIFDSCSSYGSSTWKRKRLECIVRS